MGNIWVDCIDEFALDFVASDLFLNEIPAEAMSHLKNELMREFTAHYNRQKDSQTKQLINGCRKHATESSHNLVEQSSSLDRFMESMLFLVDNFASNFINTNQFLTQ